LLSPSRRGGARVRKHGTRPLRQWHRWEKRVHCCCGCVWPYGLHGTQSTHHRWWCLGRRARAVALALEEERCACATARYAASQAVASLGEASALLLRLGVWPCGLHSAQSTHHRWWCLVRRARAVLLPLEEERCARAKARYAASQAVASLGEASARLLRLCVALRPAQRAEHPPQVVVLGEEGSSCCSCP
jgi:hypothetical protein